MLLLMGRKQKNLVEFNYKSNACADLCVTSPGFPGKISRKNILSTMTEDSIDVSSMHRV